MPTRTSNLGLPLDSSGKVGLDNVLAQSMEIIGQRLGIDIPVRTEGMYALKESYENGMRLIGRELGITIKIDTLGHSGFEQSLLGNLKALDTAIVAVKTFSITGAPTTVEGGSLAFMITRSDGTGSASVRWAVTGGTASPADFVGGVYPGAIVTFANGETTKTITLQTLDDTAVEALETVMVSLVDPLSGWTVAVGTATGTISDNDVLPTVTLSASLSKPEGNSGANVYAYTVTLGQVAPAGGVQVPYVLNLGSTDAADYTGGVAPALSGNVAIAAGATTGTLSISVNGDATVEPDELFTVTITAPAGYRAGARMSATGTIVNDDASGPTPLYAPNLTKAAAGQTIPLAGNDGWKRLTSDLAPNATNNLGVNEFGEIVQIADVENFGEAHQVQIMHEFAPGTGYTVAIPVRTPAASRRNVYKFAGSSTGYDWRGIEFRLQPEGFWQLVLPEIRVIATGSAAADLLPDGQDVHLFHDVQNKTIEIILPSGKSMTYALNDDVRLVGGVTPGNFGLSASVEAGLSPVGTARGFPPRIWPGRYLGGSGAGNPNPAAFSAAPSISRQGGGTSYAAGDTILIDPGTVDPATGTLTKSQLKRGALVLASNTATYSRLLDGNDSGRAIRVDSEGTNSAGQVTKRSSNTILVGGSGVPVPQRILGMNAQGLDYYSSSRPYENLFQPATWEGKLAAAHGGGGIALTDDNYAFSPEGLPTTMTLRDGRALESIARFSQNVVKQGTPMRVAWAGDIDFLFNSVGAPQTRNGNRIDYNHPAPIGTEAYPAFVITAIRSPLTMLDLREAAKADHADVAVRTRKYNPAYIAELSKYTPLRFMGLTNTNADWQEVSWTTRSRNSWRTSGTGMSWEDVAEITNLTKADPWINVPWWSWANDNDYVRRHAEYMRDNINPALTIYVEVQNEIWNSMFGVHHKIGQWYKYGDPNSPGPITFDDIAAGAAKRTIEVAAIWREVFAGQLGRLKFVFGTTPVTRGNPDRPKQFVSFARAAVPALLDAVDDIAFGAYFGYSVNPLAVRNNRPDQNPPGDGKIVAGTGTEHPDWTADLPTLFARTEEDINIVIDQIIDFKSWVETTLGKRPTSYEGGQSHADWIYHFSGMWNLSTNTDLPGQGEIVRPVYYAYHRAPGFADAMELFWSRWVNEVQTPLCGFVDKQMLNKSASGQPQNDGCFGTGWNDYDSIDPSSPDYAPKRAGVERVFTLNPREEVA